ncbi:MAG: hypothetical protein IKK50_01510 [Ruminiclostridium sp.]|nr:hypothetical protein [Ruminiclostridium sp.]
MYYYKNIILYHPCKMQQILWYEQASFSPFCGGFLVYSAVHCAEKTKGRAKALPFYASERASPFRRKRFRPAVRALWAHWQAEKSFLARTCRARKQIELDFATAVAKLYEVVMGRVTLRHPPL